VRARERRECYNNGFVVGPIWREDIDVYDRRGERPSGRLMRSMGRFDV